jgi:flagellar basal body rod protein FlgG
MAGGYYIALSGMRARLEALDRLSTDLANASTVGYKAERGTTAEAGRANFTDALQSAIDVANGPNRTDFHTGEIATTGRELDAAIDGPGMFAVKTPSGTRYTRSGKFLRGNDGTLTTATGMPLEGIDGQPIKVGPGNVEFSGDGTVKNEGEVVGRLKVVEFPHPALVRRLGTDLFYSDEAPLPATSSAVRAGALEQSNVSVVERMSELTSVARSFGTMERALSTLANDIDSKAITELGRH